MGLTLTFTGQLQNGENYTYTLNGQPNQTPSFNVYNVNGQFNSASYNIGGANDLLEINGLSDAISIANQTGPLYANLILNDATAQALGVNANLGQLALDIGPLGDWSVREIQISSDDLGLIQTGTVDNYFFRSVPDDHPPVGVPEASSLALLAAGAAMALYATRKKAPATEVKAPSPEASL